MTYNSKTQDVVLALLRWAIQGEDEGLPLEVGHIDADIWQEAMEMAVAQGVAALCFDSLEKMRQDSLPPKDILLNWYGIARQVEQSNGEYMRQVAAIAKGLHDKGVRVVVLKGLACSQW